MPAPPTGPAVASEEPGFFGKIFNVGTGLFNRAGYPHKTLVEAGKDAAIWTGELAKVMRCGNAFDFSRDGMVLGELITQRLAGDVTAATVGKG